MDCIVSLEQLRKLKSNIRKLLTATQLKNSFINIKKEINFLSLYIIKDGVETGLKIECVGSIKEKQEYRLLVNNFLEVLNNFSGKGKQEIKLSFYDSKVKISSDEKDYEIEAEKIDCRNENINSASSTIVISNFDIQESLELFKSLINKNNDLEVLNYTNIYLNKDLYISVSNGTCVGNAKIGVKETISENKYRVTIKNKHILQLLKWLEVNTEVDINLIKVNNYLRIYTDTMYIKLLLEEDNTICNNNNKLYSFYLVDSENRDKIDLISLQRELITHKKEETCKINIGDITKKVSTNELLNIVDKKSDIEVYLYNDDINSPLIIKNTLNNSKIIFNTLRN